MKTKKILSLVLAVLLLLGTMSVTAFAENDPTYLDLDTTSDKKDIDQSYTFAQADVKYTDVTKVKLEWTISDIAATFKSHKTWDADNLQWVEAKEDISAADQSATFTLTNYSSANMRASVSFAVEDAVKDTYDATNSTFANNHCTIETPVERDAATTYEDSDFTALAQTVTATLKFSKDKFADLSAAASATKYGTYTVTIGEANYLTFSSAGSFTLGTFMLGVTPTDDAYLQYSTDSINWTKWDGTAVTAVQNGEKYFVYLRGKGLTRLSNFAEQKVTILTLTPAGGLKKIDTDNPADNPYEESELIDCSGNIMTLLDYDNPNNVKMGEDAFRYLFYNMNYNSGYASPLRTAPALPATTLATSCYEGMFNGCTFLTSAPALPATTLAGYCYFCMFCGCTSLTSAPALPATTLANGCYNAMFSGCTSLVSAPALPATTLAEECYRDMFKFCTSLTSAPALPATTLARNCYFGMFAGCTSLTSAPALPATTLANGCYDAMFKFCTSLTSAPALPATTLAAGCYQSMFDSCTSLKVSTEGSDSNKIFTCPSTIPVYAVTDMFTNTYDSESKIGSVTAGTTYYWYTE